MSVPNPQLIELRDCGVEPFDIGYRSHPDPVNKRFIATLDGTDLYGSEVELIQPFGLAVGVRSDPLVFLSAPINCF